MNKLLYFLLLVLAVVMVGCDRTPSGVLSKGKMAELLADIHEGEGVIETERGVYYTDSLKRLLKQSIYQRHGVTREQVDSSMMWYGMHVEDYMEVYDRVIDILEKRQRDANALASDTREAGTSSVVSLEGDSIDVWTAERHRRFYDLGYNDFIVYHINKDTNWQEGDIYTLRFKAINPRTPVSAMIMVEYFDKSSDMVVRELGATGWQDMHLSLDRDKDARAVYVSIHYSPEPGESMHVDSISLVRQHRRFTLPASMPEPEPVNP